jgi:hypothetical protein
MGMGPENAGAAVVVRDGALAAGLLALLLGCRALGHLDAV